MRVFRFVITLLMLGLGAQQAQGAGNCISPGDLLDVPTPGFLNNATPNLFHRFDQTLYSADLISFTTSRMTIRIPLSGLPGGTIFKVVHVEQNGQHKVVANASTCDNWGATPPPTGVSGGGNPASPGVQIINRRNLAPGVPATRNEVVAPSGAPEFLIIGSAVEVTSAQVILLKAGVTILRSSSLPSLGLRMSVIDLNGAITLGEVRAILSRSDISVTIDKHTVYGAAADTTARSMIGMKQSDVCRLPKIVRIGVIDGPIDTTHVALANVPIFAVSVLNERERMGSTDHATGIASILAGGTGTPTPAGLAQGAELFSVVVFARAGARDVARLENIAEALDWMISRKVDVVNMSLAGPRNTTLEQILKIASDKGLILVAATGNGRQNQVSYPASDPRVFAITAIDAAKRLYRKANYGTGVDFAAPGVDLVVAGRRGTSVRTGTSYAAAVATAVIAHHIAAGITSHTALVMTLRETVEDLGEEGRDPKFGWGLIKFDGC